jgi:pimeloyl-ACP methyl ester carboxylesterase
VNLEDHPTVRRTAYRCASFGGDKDWARSSEREHDRSLIPGARMAVVENGGHFLPLDRPDAVIEQIKASAYDLLPAHPERLE